MEPMTMIGIGSLALSAVTSLGSLFVGASESKKNREMQEKVLSQSSNDMNLWKGIAMASSGMVPQGGPQMAGPGTYPQFGRG